MDSEAGLLLQKERDTGELTEVRRLLGKPTACVGRDRELGMLEALFAQCAGDSQRGGGGKPAPWWLQRRPAAGRVPPRTRSSFAV